MRRRFVPRGMIDRAFVAAAAVLVGATPAFAEGSPTTSGDAFLAGEYADARDLGRKENNAGGLAMACRSGLVLGSYFETGAPRLAALHGAIKDCGDAIAAGGAGVDAYVNYAIGLAFEAKRNHSPGLAGDARKLLEAAIARFPDSGFAQGALAGWHAQVAAQGVLARTALGASRDDARKGFDAALRLDPKNISVHYEQLRFLAEGGRAARPAALKAAATIAALPSEGAFETLIKQHAATIADALAVEGKAGRDAVARALVATESFRGVQGEGDGVRLDLPYTDSFDVRAAAGNAQ